MSLSQSTLGERYRVKIITCENDTADHFEFNDSWQLNTSTLWIHCPLWCVISKKISGPVGHRELLSVADELLFKKLLRQLSLTI